MNNHNIIIKNTNTNTKINDLIETQINSNTEFANEFANELVNKLDNELSELSELSELDELDELDNVKINKYFDSNDKLPINYGNKWTNEEKESLILMLKKTKNLESEIIKIANSLGRSVGGIRGEIKKMIMQKYLNGDSIEIICNELNLLYRNVKSIIKIYLDKEADIEINNLEKENKLLKLKIENYDLRNKLKLINL